MKNSKKYLQKKKSLLKLKNLADFKEDFESTDMVSSFLDDQFNKSADQQANKI